MNDKNKPLADHPSSSNAPKKRSRVFGFFANAAENHHKKKLRKSIRQQFDTARRGLLEHRKDFLSSYQLHSHYEDSYETLRVKERSLENLMENLDESQRNTMAQRSMEMQKTDLKEYSNFFYKFSKKVSRTPKNHIEEIDPNLSDYLKSLEELMDNLENNGLKNHRLYGLIEASSVSVMSWADLQKVFHGYNQLCNFVKPFSRLRADDEYLLEILETIIRNPLDAGEMLHEILENLQSSMQDISKNMTEEEKEEFEKSTAKAVHSKDVAFDDEGNRMTLTQ